MRKLFRAGVVMAAVVAAVLGAGQPATADPVLQVSVADARLASGGVQVVLTGRYVCGPFSPGSDGVVDLDVRQQLGPLDTIGYGYLYLTVCDGSTQSWSAPVEAVAGRFVLGRAQAVGGGYACDRGPVGGCAFGSFGPVSVRIR
jgi:hypothetical protein